MSKRQPPARLGWADSPKTETLVIRVEAQLKGDIERLAAKAGRPMASFARELLRRGVENVKARKGRAP